MDVMKAYESWLAAPLADQDLTRELESIAGQEKEIFERFYTDLSFGTAGLRGVLGAGTNRMNIYTVGRATQGLADTLKARCKAPMAAVAYDSRIKSELFARETASVLAANGVKTYIYGELMPTPALSYAVRELGCSAGVNITASHNPAKYNGYKAYDETGCQLGPDMAAAVMENIQKADIFQDVRRIPFEEGLRTGMIEIISEELIQKFIARVLEEQVNPGLCQRAGLRLVYTPLNGAGRRCVLEVLGRIGITDITVVPEQEWPDGNFPTCPYPNPEITEALALGLKLAGERQADLLLATDPDCDRVGAAVLQDGKPRLITGNEMGVLLLDYIARSKIASGRMPKAPVAVKSIVTTTMASAVAAKYGIEIRNVLTGFKFIGEQIGRLEAQGRRDSFVFGFEESYGYLSGPYVRDKDGVGAACLICEMFSFYASRGISLLDRLHELYGVYGYCLNTLHSYAFDGSAGFAKMQAVMQALRAGVASFGGKKVLRLMDYAAGLDGLPKSDVLKFILEDGCTLVARPSGTEPKLKLYFSVSGESREAAEETEQKLLKSAEALLH